MKKLACIVVVIALMAIAASAMAAGTKAKRPRPPSVSGTVLNVRLDKAGMLQGFAIAPNGMISDKYSKIIVKVAPDTKYFVASSPAKADAIKVGSRVRALLTGEVQKGRGSAVMIRVASTTPHAVKPRPKKKGH